jgi:hypothetical protein
VSFYVFKGCCSSIPLLPACVGLLFFHFFEELQKCAWPIVGLHACIRAPPLDNPRIHTLAIEVSVVCLLIIFL